jgi:hypothetical protein
VQRPVKVKPILLQSLHQPAILEYELDRVTVLCNLQTRDFMEDWLASGLLHQLLEVIHNIIPDSLFHTGGAYDLLIGRVAGWANHYRLPADVADLCDMTFIALSAEIHLAGCHG